METIYIPHVESGQHEAILFTVWLNPQIVATIANKTNDPSNLQWIKGNDSYEYLRDHNHRQPIYPRRQTFGTNGHPGSAWMALRSNPLYNMLNAPDPSMHYLLMKNRAKILYNLQNECRAENLLHSISVNCAWDSVVLMLSQAKENHPKIILFHTVG